MFASATARTTATHPAIARAGRLPSLGLSAAVALFAIASPLELSAQQSSTPTDRPAEAGDIVVSAFVGPATNEFAAVGFTVGLLDETRGWALRWAYVEEFTIFGPNPALSVWDLGVQYAFVDRTGVLQTGAAVGPALTGGVNRGRYIDSSGGWFGSNNYEKESFYTLGVIASADVTAALLPFLGLGAGLSGNLNPERSYVTASVRLVVGALR